VLVTDVRVCGCWVLQLLELATGSIGQGSISDRGQKRCQAALGLAQPSRGVEALSRVKAVCAWRLSQRLRMSGALPALPHGLKLIVVFYKCLRTPCHWEHNAVSTRKAQRMRVSYSVKSLRSLCRQMLEK
jgi:hypothetical protein